MGNACLPIKPHVKHNSQRFYRKNPDCAQHELELQEPKPDANEEFDYEKCHYCGNVITALEQKYHCVNCNRFECILCFRQTEEIRNENNNSPNENNSPEKAEQHTEQVKS